MKTSYEDLNLLDLLAMGVLYSGAQVIVNEEKVLRVFVLHCGIKRDIIINTNFTFPVWNE